MGNYNVELKIECVEDKGADAALTKNNWTGTVTADNEKGYVIAVVKNEVPKDSPTRVITTQMVSVPNAPQENQVDAGVWTRQEGENDVQAVLLDHDGKEVGRSTIIIY